MQQFKTTPENGEPAGEKSDAGMTSRRRRRRERERDTRSNIVVETAGGIATAVPSRQLPPDAVAAAPPTEPATTAAISAAIDKVESDIRVLIGLARSAVLPVASRVDLAEHVAEFHLQNLRALADPR